MPCNQLVSGWLSVYKLTINGGLVFGSELGVGGEVRVVRRARRRRNLTNSLTTLAVEHQRPVRMIRGE